LLESMTVDDNQKAVAKATDTKGNDEPKSKTEGKATGKIDTRKKRNKAGEGNEEEQPFHMVQMETVDDNQKAVAKAMDIKEKDKLK
jgi:hypothetical protein